MPLTGHKSELCTSSTVRHCVETRPLSRHVYVHANFTKPQLLCFSQNQRIFLKSENQNFWESCFRQPKSRVFFVSLTPFPTHTRTRTRTHTHPRTRTHTHPRTHALTRTHAQYIPPKPITSQGNASKEDNDAEASPLSGESLGFSHGN
jgi:hypothetical protein